MNLTQKIVLFLSSFGLASCLAAPVTPAIAGQSEAGCVNWNEYNQIDDGLTLGSVKNIVGGYGYTKLAAWTTPESDYRYKIHGWYWCAGTSHDSNDSISVYLRDYKGGDGNVVWRVWRKEV